MVEKCSFTIILFYQWLWLFHPFLKIISKNDLVQNTILLSPKGLWLPQHQTHQKAHTECSHQVGYRKNPWSRLVLVNLIYIYGYNVCLWKAPLITATQIEQNPHRCLGANSILTQTSSVPLHATEHPASQWKLASTPCGQLRNDFEQVLPQPLFNSIFLDVVKGCQIPGLETQHKYKSNMSPIALMWLSSVGMEATHVKRIWAGRSLWVSSFIGWRGWL